ncbi:MAG: adenylyltransferase [Chloroflexi bacterium CG_4_10_14_0_8_um_filter_46_9]|nr:MAG: adenylyltransferase [Dehalococcoidia bacterium CG2_30_46_19]PIW40719.1 MAG: adenylyltransferase [Chloroflexi bacterium CG15_BIG_FIL_POST_REV_8_21_14_020_46_15]PIZ26652.1 MAG: adenylyltransferase [Chloroflexi bacterium CG_4_10_14_0_8_um_filter_46_9]
MLTENELKRYERQIRIFGADGQERLKNAKVFVAGAGGLGSAISIYLAAAGIGGIRIVDHEKIELSNLNRQILYCDEDVGREKAASAEEKLKKINPDVSLEAISETIEENNVLELVGDFDLIVDAMDNFHTRYLLNRTAIVKNIPFFYGAINGLYGQATTIIPGKTACLRCIFPEPPLSMTFPVVGATCGVIGCIQVTEIVKYIVKMGSSLENRLLLWDGLNAKIDEIEIERNPSCEDCGWK